MKKNFKKLCALVLAFAMIATDALPVAAARKTENPFLNHFHHESYEGMTGIDLSTLSKKALEFLEGFDVEEFKSAFGKKVEGYNTEALKDAIWQAIFVKRDSNLIDVKSLGISQDVMDALVDEVLAEANAEEAVTYAVRKDAEGNATEIQVAIDPLYAEAYAEIEAGTINASSSNYTVNAASDEIVVAEGEQEQPAEPTMEEAIAYFNEYQKFIDDNPDLFGVTVPYTSVKDDANEGGGPITSLVTIANQKVDFNGDGVIDANDNGLTMLDLFKMGYVPAKDLIQIIQMFHLGNQLAAGMLGEQLVATMQEALAAIPNDATDVQKLLILNDWLADKATFNMASIMELPAPQPTTPEIFYHVVGALQEQGLPEADAQMLAQNLMGLWGGNQFGVLTPAMGHTGVCMSYTYAYAYLVQWAFPDVYKNADGTWKSRLELNYIENPNAEMAAPVMLLAEGDDVEGEEPVVPEQPVDPETPVVPEQPVDPETPDVPEQPETPVVPEEPEHVCDFAPTPVWGNWDENHNIKAWLKCKDETCEKTQSLDVAIAKEETAPTCTEAGYTVFTAKVVVGEETHTKEDKVTGAEATGHTFAELPTFDWSEDLSDAKAWFECTAEGCEYRDNFEDVTVAKVVTAPTCTEQGYTTHTATAKKGEKVYNADKVTDITAATGHDFGEDGNASACTVCKAANDGHECVYSNVTWSEWEQVNGQWTVSAFAVCTDCDEPIKLVPAVTFVTTAATCTAAGETVYTAVVEGEFTNPTSTHTEVLPALGHKHDETKAPDVWNWANDNKSAKAVYYCTVCSTEEAPVVSKEIAATMTSKSTVTTCAEAGEITYTATVGEFTDSKTVAVAAGKHKIDAQGTCTVCGEMNIPQYIWDPSAPAMVDFVRITYDTEVTMYGESQGHFDSVHYWNAVKVNGQWYYVDPCYTDIYVECMIRDRVETDGNMSHLYFMFSDTNARELYAGNFSNIDTLYQGVATDTTYEKAWFAFARSPIYKSGKNYVYYYDSTDMIALTLDAENSYNTDIEYKIVAHDGTKADTDNSFATLIDFNNGQILAERNGQAVMQDNAMIKELFEEHQAYQAKYPSVDISCDMEGSKVYFNIANCVLSYDVKTYEVVKVFEYNEVTAQRDLTQGLGGMAFKVIDPEEAAPAEEGAELTTLTVENNPIASMTIKNGNMYVSIGTSIGFISGKKSMSAEDTSIGYQFEETNYNEDYMMFVMSEGQMGEEEVNDNDEFMWSANFVDVIPMSHVSGSSHTYEEVSVDATCGKNAYTENRCTECGMIENGSRVEVADTALDHHFIKFDEQYYTKEGNAWNTGSCYVCTICKDAKDPDELEATDKVGHTYSTVVTWSEDYTSATFAVLCETCHGVNYDCVIADQTVVKAEGIEATEITAERTTEVNAETGEKAYYWIYTATATIDGMVYSDTIKVAREADRYDNNPFTDVEEGRFYYKPVLWAVEKGITTGTTETTFEPNATCTRAQAVTFLYRQAGQPKVENVDVKFTDIKEGSFYYDAVLWAVSEGITAGTSETTFEPDAECTRAQIVTFIWRMCEKPEATNTEVKFTDINENAFYYDAVLWAVEEGITTGVTETTFEPSAACTRGHIVTFLYREFGDGK